MRNWKVGDKLSTVLNYPVLLDGTPPVHVLLEVTEVVQMEGVLVPKTRALMLAPIEDQNQILELLKQNRDFPPNLLRLKLKEAQDQQTLMMEALNEFNTTLIDVGAEAKARLDRLEQQRYAASTKRRQQ